MCSDRTDSLTLRDRVEVGDQFRHAANVIRGAMELFGLPFEALEAEFGAEPTMAVHDAKAVRDYRNELAGWSRWYVQEYGDGTAVLRDFADLLEPARMSSRYPRNGVQVAHKRMGLGSPPHARWIANRKQDGTIEVVEIPEDGPGGVTSLISELDGKEGFNALRSGASRELAETPGLVLEFDCESYDELLVRIELVAGGIRRRANRPTGEITVEEHLGRRKLYLHCPCSQQWVVDVKEPRQTEMECPNCSVRRPLANPERLRF